MKRNIIFITLLIVVSVFITSCSKQLPDTDIMTESEVILNRFPYFNKSDIIYCYWKAEKITQSIIGPSSYKMRGYLKITDEKSKEIKEEYYFQHKQIDFEDGFEPDSFGFVDCEWGYNYELSYTKITQSRFVGSFYFDKHNNIFYFEVDSN